MNNFISKTIFPLVVIILLEMLWFATWLALPTTSFAGSAANSELVVCAEPRPRICTHDYTPVCATRDTGIRCITTPCPTTKEITYSNGCTACSDKNVIAYRPGACDSP